MESEQKKNKSLSPIKSKSKEEKCNHVWEYNDETMGGIFSNWDRRCINCDYFEKE